MIKKGESSNKVFRMFYSDADKKSFKKLLKWNASDATEKRVSSYNGGNSSVYAIKVTDTDEKLRLTFYTLSSTVTFNSAFIRSKLVWSVGYNKVTKRLYVDNMPALRSFFSQSSKVESKILKAIGFEAFACEPTVPFNILLNKVTLKAIVTGNCTNLNDLVKRYFSSIGIKDMNLNRFKTYIEYNGFRDTSYLPLILCTNKDVLFNNINKLRTFDTTTMNDTMSLAVILKAQLNFNWSEKRFSEEHDRMSKLVSSIKIKTADPTPIEYFGIKEPEVEGVTLLKSSRELVMESEELKHCVGTSDTYFNKLTNYEILLFKYNRFGFRGTVELAINDKAYTTMSRIPGKVRVLQFEGLGRKAPPDLVLEDFIDIVNTTYKDFIQAVNKKLDLKPGFINVPAFQGLVYDEGLPF